MRHIEVLVDEIGLHLQGTEEANKKQIGFFQPSCHMIRGATHLKLKDKETPADHISLKENWGQGVTANVVGWMANALLVFIMMMMTMMMMIWQ